MPAHVNPGTPPDPVSDADRELAARRLQRATGEGRVTLAEFSDRVAAVWAARTGADLDRATAGIAPPVVGSYPGSRVLVSILGDQRRAGRWRVPRRLRAYCLIGDLTLDLRAALVDAESLTDGVVEVSVVSLIGDVRVVVPEGVEVELTGLSLLGDRTLELARVPPRVGTPRLRLRAYGLITDVVVRSAAGEYRQI